MAGQIAAPAPLGLLTEEDIRARVRYHAETRRFSLIDVVGLVCGVSRELANARLSYLLSSDDTCWPRCWSC